MHFKSGIITLTLIERGSGMWVADNRPLTWIAPFPSRGADYTLEGRNALHSTPASALLQQICASATITTTAHSPTTNRLHHSATTTHTRDHTTNISITSALCHDIPNAPPRATRDVTTHPLLAQQHHSAALPITSRQSLILPAHSQSPYCAHSSAPLALSSQFLRQPRPQLFQDMHPTS
jgi:hypothetical protein